MENKDECILELLPAGLFTLKTKTKEYENLNFYSVISDGGEKEVWVNLGDSGALLTSDQLQALFKGIASYLIGKEI